MTAVSQPPTGPQGASGSGSGLLRYEDNSGLVDQLVLDGIAPVKTQHARVTSGGATVLGASTGLVELFELTL